MTKQIHESVIPKLRNLLCLPSRSGSRPSGAPGVSNPDALVGHSVGEVAAAYLGGALSFDDAIKVICHRGQLMQQATGLGKMAAIELSEADVERLLDPYGDRVSTAAINSPTSIVISGETAAIDEIVAAAKSRGVSRKLLPVNYAFHSPQMEPFGTEMAAAVSGLARQAVSVPIYSTVTGALAMEEDFDALYWGRNIRQTVRFAAATARCSMRASAPLWN